MTPITLTRKAYYSVLDGQFQDESSTLELPNGYWVRLYRDMGPHTYYELGLESNGTTEIFGNYMVDVDDSDWTLKSINKQIKAHMKNSRLTIVEPDTTGVQQVSADGGAG